MTEVFIVGAARTAIGALMGTLKAVPAHKLGSIAIKEALTRAGVKPEQIDEVCDLLDSYGRPALYACHCSGENTLRQLKQKMPEYIHPIAAGWKHTF